MSLILEGSPAHVELVKRLRPETIAHTHEPISVVGLTGGMASGKPSVGIYMFLPNEGGCMIGQTSLALFLTIADGLKARFGDPRQ